MKFLVILFLTVLASVSVSGQARHGHVERRVVDNGHRILYNSPGLKCDNEFRSNPCGPEAACEETEHGISCASGWKRGCPPGCGNHADCLQNEHGIFSCVCHDGFEKPSELSLMCVTKDEAVEYREWMREKELETSS